MPLGKPNFDFSWWLYEMILQASCSCTLSRELPLSLFFSDRLLPESVLMSEPRESAWRTELMLGVDEVWGEAVKTNKQRFFINKKKKKLFFSHHFFSIIFQLTGARDDSKNIFVQAGVQKGAGPGRCHQSIGKKWVFSSILRKNSATG